MQVQSAFAKYWGSVSQDIAWYFPSSKEESDRLIDLAIADGVDCIIAGGGDGTIASIGKKLIGTNVVLGVIPLGSGNGLARHFSQSLKPVDSIRELANSTIVGMDVGYINEHPFLVSASIAWESDMVDLYNRFPVRGVGSYVMAGIGTFFTYRASETIIKIPSEQDVVIKKPLLLTLGNLSGWGGGAFIDVEASGCDGKLELVYAETIYAPMMLAHITRVFETGLKSLPYVTMKKIREAKLVRKDPVPIQLDGELIEAGLELDISVKQNMLKVLVPQNNCIETEK
jgi:diacylglycerol kinase family enzyme